MDVGRLHPVAQLYALSTLDCLVALAAAVAEDRKRRPDRYRHLSADVDAVLAETDVPDLAERTLLYEVISGGPPEGLSPLAAAEWSFREGAREVTETKGEQRELRAAAFVERSATLRSFLELVGGDAAAESAARVIALFDRVTTLFTSDELAQTFGAEEAPRDPWPLAPPSPAGAHLVEVISDDLQPEGAAGISQYEFLVLQRLATHRGEVIQAVLDGRFDDGAAATPESLSPVAAWQSALDDFEVAIAARNWRGQSGRLIPEERPSAVRSPIDRTVLSRRVLDFMNACAAGGT